MNTKNIRKKGLVTAMIVISMIAGAVGGSQLSGTKASAQTVSTTPSPVVVAPTTGSTTDNSVSNAPTGGTFHSNENAAHEATESPAREAQENAGQRPTVK